MMRCSVMLWVVLLPSVLGCSGEDAPPSHTQAPAHVESPIPEADLPRVHLTEAAIARLGIETAMVTVGARSAIRLVGGEVVIPPGRAIVVAAPVAGVVRAGRVESSVTPGTSVRRGEALFRIVPVAPVDRDVRARAAREVAAARATLATLEARVARQELLARERAGSARVLEEAILARDIAAADLAMAEAREATLRRTPLLADVTMVVPAPEDGVVRTLSVAEGQAVAQGAPLAEIVAVDALQIRVPVYAGDLARLDPARNATVRRLGEPRDAPSFDAIQVLGPPTAEPDRITVDRYFAVPEAQLSPGERVLVSLPLLGEEHALSVPHAAVVLDASGGAWVYVCEGERTFRRARIDPIRRTGELTVFARGPAAGACVVSVGAAEVFGSEFEPGH